MFSIAIYLLCFHKKLKVDCSTKTPSAGDKQKPQKIIVNLPQKPFGLDVKLNYVGCTSHGTVILWQSISVLILDFLMLPWSHS